MCVCDICSCLELAMLGVFLGNFLEYIHGIIRMYIIYGIQLTSTHIYIRLSTHNSHKAETFDSLTSFGLVTISCPQHLHSTGRAASQTRADGRVSSCFGESVVDGPSWHVLLPWPRSSSASVGWAQMAIQVRQEVRIVRWVVRFMPMKIISQTATWWRNPKLWRRPSCGAAWPYANLYLNAWRWSFQKPKEVNRKKGDWWTLIWLAKVSKYHCRMEPMEPLPQVLWNWWKSTHLCGVAPKWTHHLRCFFVCFFEKAQKGEETKVEMTLGKRPWYRPIGHSYGPTGDPGWMIICFPAFLHGIVWCFMLAITFSATVRRNLYLWYSYILGVYDFPSFQIFSGCFESEVSKHLTFIMYLLAP